MLSTSTVARENTKETETEEAIGFVITFLLLVAFQLGGKGPLGLPLATSMHFL